MATGSPSRCLIPPRPVAGGCSPGTRWRADRLVPAGKDGREPRPGQRLVVTTVVSSTLLSKIAAAAGARYAETLTGFKWIVRAGQGAPGSRFLFGYEEALGYAVGDVVRDKDGISASLAILSLAATARAAGQSLLDRWDALEAGHGVHLTAQLSLHAPSPAGTWPAAGRSPGRAGRPAGDRLRRSVRGRPGRDRPAACRRADLPAARRPGGDPAERHRAEAQGLPGGRRAGQHRARWRPPARPRPRGSGHCAPLWRTWSRRAGQRRADVCADSRCPGPRLAVLVAAPDSWRPGLVAARTRGGPDS